MNKIFPKLNQGIHNDNSITSLLYKTIDKLLSKGKLSKEEYLYILDNITEFEMQYLFKTANSVKEKYYQKKVYLRALIEISNYCSRGCFYCGINRSNLHVKRYHLSKEQILSCASKAYLLGYRTFVLQGGEDAYFNDSLLVDIISDIKNKFPDSRITLSLGEKSYNSYKLLKDAGADRYLLRHETATESHYNLLHPKDMSYKTRIDALYNLKKLGFQTGGGFMVGSPFQMNFNLANDLLFLEKLQPEMVGIGPFIDHEHTKFKDFKNGGLYETLIMVSLARLVVPRGLIPATTALGTIEDGGREMALKSGANVLMPNFSPTETVDLYKIYRNKLTSKDNYQQFRDRLEIKLKNNGHNVDYSVGDFMEKEGIYNDQ
ncbi:MAG: [FeFe] hydrogenase H-cluster radical SAM maturase HydE [Candidatus Izemoplasma sp.]